MNRHGTVSVTTMAPRVSPGAVPRRAVPSLMVWSLFLLSMWVLGIQVAAGTAADNATQSHRPLTLDEIQIKPRVHQVELDPTGSRIAFLLREQEEAAEGLSLWLQDLRTGDKRRLTTSRSLSSVHWSTDGRELFLETDKSLGRISVDGGRPSWIFKFDPERHQRWAGVDPSLPRHFLVLDEGLRSTDGEAEPHQLLRIDDSGLVETVISSRGSLSSWLTDGSGNVRYLKETVRSDSERTSEHIEQVIFALDGAEPARGTTKREIYRCPILDPCGLVAEDAEAGRLWIRTYHGGDRRRLVSVPLGEGGLDDGRRSDGGPGADSSIVEHEDPEGIADLGQVLLDRGGAPRWVSYDTDRRRWFGLDAESERHARRVRDRFDGASVNLQARDLGSLWIVEENRARLHHTRFHTYDPITGVFRKLLSEERESVERVPEALLVDARPITYTARDGMRIHAYVWLPEHLDVSRAPVVAHIHGGPWNRERYGFSSKAQLLVSRGYVVFQPNFRGSSGYGRQYMVAAKGHLSRGAVQEDILDGLEFLASRGWGDPERRAITGHSYGGYAALGASVHHPGEYVAAVATAAPIDLVRSFRDMDPQITQRNGVAFKDWARPLFVDLDDAREVAEERAKAPEANVQQTALPLLVMAGGQDVKIDVTDVKHYASLLADAGRDVTLLIDDEAGHGFETPHMRSALFFLMDQFLAKHLGGPAPAFDDPELEAYMDGRLRLVGESLTSVLESPE